MVKKSFIRIVWLLLLFLSGTSARIKEDQPNILWVSIEDLSPIIGAYGDKQAWTPNINQLAAEGVLYRNAYATSPICSPSRSSLITGINATSLGTQQLRSEMPIPEFIKILPQYLAAKGYFTTNNSKTDYNFDPANRWDDNGDKAHWRNRPAGKPFFSVFNFMTTHEGRANVISEKESKILFKDLAKRHLPQDAKLPPYLPKTPEMERIWAHYYDLVTVVDLQIGQILTQLKEDGLNDNTIVIFFSDHGTGLPRYKRWPYRTGLQVPLVIKMPPKYRHLIDEAPGTESGRLVSLLDLAPSMLRVANVEVPKTMQGVPFLGLNRAKPREYMVAFRSRADDIFEVSRTVIDSRYLYIRNYMPHQPWIQTALIFSDEKDSYRELLRVKKAGNLPVAQKAMFTPKPLEELYDLLADPNELNNLAASQNHARIMNKMRTRLKNWILTTRDTDFLPESEIIARSAGSTPYQMATDKSKYDLTRILATSEKVGDKTITSANLRKDMLSLDSGVRYWAALAFLARAEEKTGTIMNEDKKAMHQLLRDASPAVQITAAEGLCFMGEGSNEVLAVLATNLKNEQQPWVVLQAASSIRRIGDKAKPLVPELIKVRQKHSGNIGRGGYKDWLYSMFIGFAIDQALINTGSPWQANKDAKATN